MIELYCQHCGHPLKIPDQYAGRTGTCKNCGKKILVPVEGFEPDPVSARTQKAKDIPYKWIAAAAAITVVLAVGIFMFVSRDASVPAASSPEAPTARRVIEFPSDRVVGELRLRDIGDPWWGTPIGEARGPFAIPDHQEVGVSVNRHHAPDLSFLRDIAPDALSFLMIARPGIDDRQLKNIEHLTGLKSILAGNSPITDDGLRSFSALKQLEVLRIAQTNITDEGLARLSGLERLTTLSLARTKVTHRGIRAIRSLQNITTFHLSPSALTRPMVDALKEFPNLSHLTIETDYVPYDGFTVDPSLDLDPEVPTSPASILLLKDLPHLRDLLLRGTLNDDSLIPALSKLRFLEVISFDKTSVSPGARNQLRRALPNCTIMPQDPLAANIAENLSPPSPNFPDFTGGKKYVSLAVDTQSAFTLNPEDMSFNIGERREFFAGLGNIRERPGFSFAFETVDALDFGGETFHTLRFILPHSYIDFYTIMRDDGFYFYHYLDDDAPRFFIEFPLKPGMRWSHDIYRDGEGRGTPERQTVTQHYYADAEETIRTPAGTFTCIRVLMGDTPPQHDGPDVYANWYAKGFGGNVQVRLADGTVHMMKSVIKP